MLLDYIPYRLHLKDPFRISHGSYSFRETLIVRLQSGEYSGLGEATVINYYGQTLQGMKSVLSRMSGFIKELDMEYPPLLWEKLHEEFGDDNSFCLSALDCATWDIWGKMEGRAVHNLLFPEKEDYPPTSFTIGGGSLEEMQEKVRATDWPVYKIKTGMEDDLSVLRALRKVTDRPFRIDANAAMSKEEAETLWPELEALGVELAEQPYPPAMDLQVADLRKLSNVPCFADESCRSADDLQSLSHSYDGVNIKLMKCGGLSPAVEMAEIARDLGLKVMIGCMTESSIGIAASACLLPAVDYADLDGPLLVRNDPAESIRFSRGQAFFPGSSGLGIRLKAKFFD